MLSGPGIALDDRQDASTLGVLPAVKTRPQVENLQQQRALNFNRRSRMLRFVPNPAAKGNNERTSAY